MAGIDKIYGTREQRKELKRFIRCLRLPGNIKRAMYRSFYPAGYPALTIFPCWADRLLWKQSALPKWAREAIAFQYKGSPIKVE